MTRRVLPGSNPLRMWEAYAFAVISVVALALLTPIPEVRAASTLLLVLGTGIAGFARRSAYGALTIALCLILNGWLTPNLFPGSYRLVGVNVANIATAVGFVTYLLRARPRIRWPWTSITVFCAMLVALDVVVVLRGMVLAEEMRAYVTGFLHMWCLWLWVRRASTELSRADILRLGAAIAAGPILVAVSTLIAMLTLHPTTYTELMIARGSGLYDPNYAMLGGVMVVPWTIMNALRAGASTFQRIVSGVLVIAFLVALPYSGSRTAMAAALGAVVMSLFLRRRPSTAVLIVVSAAIVYLIWQQLPSVLVERFESVQGFKEARGEVYGNAIREFLINPLFGTGRFTYFRGSNASVRLTGHNTILVDLAEGGLIYVLVLMGLIFVIARVGLKDWRRTHDWVPLSFIIGGTAFLVGSNGIGISLTDYVSSILAASCALMCGAQMRQRIGRPFGTNVPRVGSVAAMAAGGRSLIGRYGIGLPSSAAFSQRRCEYSGLHSGAELPKTLIESPDTLVLGEQAVREYDGDLRIDGRA